MHHSDTVVIILTLAVYFLFSAAVDAMLPPARGQERTFYGWLYRFLQGVAANASRLAEARFHLGFVPPAPLPPSSPDPADPDGLPLGSLTASASSVEITEQVHYTLNP